MKRKTSLRLSDTPTRFSHVLSSRQPLPVSPTAGDSPTHTQSQPHHVLGPERAATAYAAVPANPADYARRLVIVVQYRLPPLTTVEGPRLRLSDAKTVGGASSPRHQLRPRFAATLTP